MSKDAVVSGGRRMSCKRENRVLREKRKLYKRKERSWACNVCDINAMRKERWWPTGVSTCTSIISERTSSRNSGNYVLRVAREKLYHASLKVKGWGFD